MKNTVIFIIAAVAFSWLLITNITKIPPALMTYTWAKTQGKVLSIDYGSFTGRKGKVLKVEYEYEAAGEKYTSDKGTIDDFSIPFWSSYGEYKKRYSPGKTVEVYYNASNPGKAVLERGVHFDTLFIIGLAAAVFFKMYKRVKEWSRG